MTGWARVRFLLIAGLALSASLSGGCSALAANRSAILPGGNATPFLAPTMASTLPAAAPTGLPLKAQAPTAAPACTNNLTFIDDLSIKDGTVFAPGAALDKRWKVENSGTCNWDRGYRMKLIAGSELGVPSEQALYPARGGSQAVIRLVFTAPDAPGSYRSAWQAYSPQGEPFGDPFYIDILVETSTATP